MKDTKELIDIYHYLGLVKRKRWFIIIPFCIALVVGIYFSITTPEVYEATTLIMVEPQRVPKNYVKSIVSTDIASRISNISKQILSRTNIESIITKFNLYSEPDQKDMFMEDKLASLRKRIAVEISRARGGYDAFSISFKGTDPQKVTNITNALATYFIDENLKVRESQATGTNVFLDEELTNTRRRLEQIEASLNAYRKKYMGELPEQLNSNLSILGRMQEQLVEKQKSIRETKAMLATLQQQINDMPSFQFDDSFLTSDDSLAIEGEGSAELAQLKEELSQLQLRYTDRHPDVVKLKNTIARLEARIEKESAAAPQAEVSDEPTQPEMTSGLPEFNFQDLQKKQTDEIRRDIRQQEAEVAQLIQNIAVYQQRIENTPKRESDLLSLQRDYDNIKASYDSLVQRKLEAEIAVNMERKQKGEQFRILDSAKLPQKPISPDVMRFLLVSVVAGLGIGGGLVFLLDYFDNSIRKQDVLETDIGIPVLSTIPRIYRAADKRWIRINQVMTALSILVAVTLIAGFSVLAIKGVVPTIAYVRQFVKL